MTPSSTPSVQVHPIAQPGGTLTVPGDKSISHRVAILAGLSHGTSHVDGFLRCEDCLHTVTAMETLGARFDELPEGGLRVEGAGGRLTEPPEVLDVGNSGTTMRLLPGILAGQSLTAELTGDASLRSRPMGRIKEPLEQMGATVELLGDGKYAPVRVTGGRLRGITYELPVASAQVKSCVLLAGLFAEGQTTVVEPRPTRDHTERLLTSVGVDLSVKGARVTVQGHGCGGPRISARDWFVPGDFSSAAFLLLAVAGRAGARVELSGVGLNPRRTAFLDVLKRMGASVETTLDSAETDPEPYGRIRVEGCALHGAEVSGDEIPNLIDELPLVAAAGAIAEGTTSIRDAAELRVKESDRIAAMANNLRALGVRVEDHPDGLSIEGGTALRAAGALRSYGDHRIAMAAAVLAVYAEEPVIIEDVACTETSYPGFWMDLEKIGVQIER